MTWLQREETMLNDEMRERQKYLDIKNSIAFCLAKVECKPFMKFLLQSTMALDHVPAGLDHDAMIEVATMHRVGNILLKSLMESSPELTGKLLIEIEKEKQNERDQSS